MFCPIVTTNYSTYSTPTQHGVRHITLCHVFCRQWW